jgi:uncharacterized membrane protein YedE/YeeE
MDILIQPNAWLRALAGGALIGLSAAGLMAFNGRVAGISGIFGGLVLDRRPGDSAWRVLFLAGLLLGPLLVGALSLALPVTLPTGWITVVLGGLLVGFGTRLGHGCTSGHGICGMARLSKRSFAATATFMGFGFLTVFLLRHVISR